MKHRSIMLAALAGATSTILTTAVTALVSQAIRARSLKRKRAEILAQLPQDLVTWRQPGDSAEAEHRIWELLDPFLLAEGLSQFVVFDSCAMATPANSWPSTNGYQYCLAIRGLDSRVVGSVHSLKSFNVSNPLKRAARTKEGQDVILRVITINNQGNEHLDLLRMIATSPTSLLTNNHTLPMLREIHIDQITIGVFPKVGKHDLQTIMDSRIWARNSVGDVLQMIMQALEALVFIHDRNIVHRDAFLDNFVIQWQPESMRTGTISPSIPRVFLIDFELAQVFDAHFLREECTLSGIPSGGSLTECTIDKYSRKTIPEMLNGTPYDPFKVDVWQLATALTGFESTIPEVDVLLEEMRSLDPEIRMDANVALARLGKIVHAIPPQDLHIAPVVVNSSYLSV